MPLVEIIKESPKVLVERKKTHMDYDEIAKMIYNEYKAPSEEFRSAGIQWSVLDVERRDHNSICVRHVGNEEDYFLCFEFENRRDLEKTLDVLRRKYGCHKVEELEEGLEWWHCKP